jgi:asparagine synthase (glutamine-hydrolysing)
MCGIAVAIDWPGAEAAIGTLTTGLLHRGDVTDPMVSPWSGTAMQTRRLRIVDGARGVQPQVSADGRILVSFNGEIYNHAALRRELETLGVRFLTASDTEVLANALAVWGGAGLARLKGMFAFVAIDLKTREFVAARDPFGEKPLYLIQAETGFLFCSEIRPLLTASETGEVLLLPPGYALTRSFCRPFYALPAPADLRAGAPKELDALLADAVERCIPPDLPFATMLSGGIDSTLIAHYARRVRPEAPGYFLGGEDAPDFPYAARYAETSGIDLRILPFDGGGEETFARLDAVIEAVESFEPSVVRPSVCSYLLSEAIGADGYRVALVGEGADELFCGYEPLEVGYDLDVAMGASLREQSLSMLGRSALQRTDRCAMRFEVEARAPFLDAGVVEHAFALDPSALVARVGGAPRGKAALRALYDLYPTALPALIRDRSKLPLNEGVGLDASQTSSRLKRHVEERITDADYAYGRHMFEGFALESKEELYYLRTLAKTMDVTRVPHLKGRLKLAVPDVPGTQSLKARMA